MTFINDMARLLLLLFCLCTFLFVNSENSQQDFSSEIGAVLNHLNSSSIKLYKYKEVVLLRAYIKSDITELSLDVAVECINKYPDVPCNEKFLNCHAFVQRTPEGLQILNNVDCRPKPQIVVDDTNFDYPTNPSEIAASVNEPQNIGLRNEAVSAEVNEPFVAVRKDIIPCVGCPFDLNPNVEGVNELVDLGLEHVASEKGKRPTMVKVLRLQQQVVSGIKYILTVQLQANSDATEDTTYICQITYFQKPWISKEKHIIANNCTESQEYVKISSVKPDISNEIEINGTPESHVNQPNFNQIAETGTMEEMPPARLFDLESQIMQSGGIETPEGTTPTKTDEEQINITESDDRPKRAIAQYEKISPEEKPIARELADFAAAALDYIDDDNNRRVILQILSAKKMVRDDGVYYHFVMRLATSKCLEDQIYGLHENCREKLFENETKLCRVQVFVGSEANSFPKLVKSQCLNKDKNDNNRTNYTRFKRQLGGHTNIDKNGAKVTELVQLATKHYNLQSSGSKQLKAVEVVSATSQVVAGVAYNIDVKLAETECSKNDGKDLNACSLTKDSKPKICHFKIWEKSWENFRQLTIECDGEKSYKVETKIDRRKREAVNDGEFVEKNIEESYSRLRREVLVGGHTNIDKNGAKVTELVQLATKHYNLQSSGSKQLKVVEVISATSQVVAGVAYNINVKLAETECSKNDGKELNACSLTKDSKPKICHFKIWEKSWQNFRQITIECDGEKSYKVETKINRRKREAVSDGEFVEKNIEEPYSRLRREVLVGGHTNIDKNGAKVTELVQLGTKHYNLQSSGNKQLNVLEVISATSQVVAGVSYNIDVKLAETECSKNDGKDLNACPLVKNTKPKICHFNIWEKSWENFRQFTIKCDEELSFKVQTTVNRRKRAVINEENIEGSSKHLDSDTRFNREVLKGGHKNIDKNGSTVTELVQQATKHYNLKSTGSKQLKVVEVLSATSQVVAGAAYNIDVKLAETECSKNDGKELNACPLVKDTEPKICHFKIWEKLWENFREFTIECDGEEAYKVQTTANRRKREATNDGQLDSSVITFGGHSKIDKNGTKVTELVQLGTKHYNLKSSRNNQLKVVEVISATSQVVAGDSYNIDLKLAETECSKNDGKDLSACPLVKNTEPKICHFNIWEKSWENFRQFTIKCDGEEAYKVETTFDRRKRAVSNDDEFVEKYIEESLKQLDSNSNFHKKLKVDQIISINKQIVTGHIFKIKAKVVISDCDKTTNKNRNECGTLESSEEQICDFKIYEALWIPNSRQIKTKCEPFRKTETTKTQQPNELDENLTLTMFNDFVEKYNRKYTKTEFIKRLKIFRHNLLHITLLNALEQGTATYGVTKFADLSQEEFSDSRGLRSGLRAENEPPFAQAQIPKIDIPTEFDWRTKGAVTEVKDQEQCGSCWAFSVTGNVEGQYAIKHSSLLEFSEQELVDCDTDDQGCNGGLMDNAYRQIEKLGGLETEQNYPYDAQDEKCHFNKSLAKVQLSGAVNISQDEGDMAKWLVANGPISIAINANAMQFYMGGISHPFKFLCNPNNLDHGVLIVGYGIRTYPLYKKTYPYWIVKNSWGKSWGEQGYYRVYRGDGTCGVNQTPSSAIVV